MKPQERLRLLARAAIVKTKGNMDSAFETLDKTITAENDAMLERELCSTYRRTALRALLATHYNELRAEGAIRRPRGADTHVDTTDYERTSWNPGPPAPRAPTPSQINDDAQRALQRQWLDDFKINGQPIGDCTVAEAEVAADRREKDARFIRALIHGLPSEGRIRDYRSAEDAEKCWNAASTTD